jgi:hypothetical protein
MTKATNNKQKRKLNLVAPGVSDNDGGINIRRRVRAAARSSGVLRRARGACLLCNAYASFATRSATAAARLLHASAPLCRLNARACAAA